VTFFVRPFRRLGPYLRPHVPTLIAGGLLAIVAGGMEGAIAWLVKPAMDEIFVRRDLFMLKLIPLAVVGAYVV
jgi:subfamily B ATP-binding cassette protein MsbA